MPLTQRDSAYHTYGDYLAWPDDVRYELIDGAAFLMAPAPSRLYQEVVGKVYRQTANALEGKPRRPYIAPFDVRLPKADEIDDRVDTVVQPDLLVVCDPRKLDERGMRGAPDWVVEVLLPASASHDQTVKLAAYERAGVRELWLLHPTDRVVTIFRIDGNRYGRPAIHETIGELAVEVLPEVRIDWARVFPDSSARPA
jgi:Uma2 family endonuclease